MLKGINNNDKNLIIGSILGIILFTGLLLDVGNFFSRIDKSNLKTIGKIATAGDDIRRKIAANFLWSDIGNQEDIFAGDSIFTGPTSRASINLKGAAIISVTPNSLVTLNFIGDVPVLDLEFGNFETSIRANEKFMIRIGDKTYEMVSSSDAAFVIDRDADGNPNFRVTKGDLQLTQAQSGAKFNISQGDKFGIDANGNTTKNQAFKFKNSLIVKNEVKWLDEKSNVHLAWSGSGDYANYQVEISDDPNFTSIIETVKAKDAKAALSKLKDNKQYYWRVKAFDANGTLLDTSYSNAFTVKLPKPPLVKTPENAVFRFDRDENDKFLTPPQAQLEWQSSDGANRFKVQISRSADFKEVLLEKEVNSSEFVTPELPSGTYFYRIASLAEGRPASQYGQVNKFEVRVEAPDITLTPPKLAQENINFDSSRLPEDTKVRAPFIRWQSVDATAEYIVEVSNSPSFSQILERVTTKATSWAWKDYRPGANFFRVRTLSPKGRQSLPSNIGKITAQISPPRIKATPLITFEGKTWDDPGVPQKTTIKWESLPQAVNYKIEVATKPDFSNPQETIVPSTSADYTLPTPGDYFFRVTPFGKKENALTNVSEVAKVTYRLNKPLKDPSLIEPANDMTFFLQVDEEPYIWMEWEATANTEFWALEIATDKDFKKIILQDEVPKAKYLLKKKISKGSLYWRVKSLNKSLKLQSKWSEQKKFSLYAGNADSEGGEE